MSDIGNPFDHKQTPQIMEEAGRAMPGLMAHALRVLIWGTFHFFLSLIEQIAALFAPLLLVVGGIWLAVRHAAGMVNVHEDHVQEAISQATAVLGHDVLIAGHILSPLGLIIDGLILVAIAAACHTLGLVLINEMYADK
ncbi:hypothetical protein [Granulibacter bethesdensis]|uniref:hypothetical protein n=1 Tax=Granulibacter bethesdensis TaxID=364410 RepID=UPI0009346617|nr:hypothetical protein [Granulibacter bethesdensis]